MSEEYGPLEALLDYGQADMEGIIVTTSRQAIHEVADELTALRAENAELREALIHAEAILSYTPRMSTNKGGKGPNTNTEKTLSIARAALAKGEK